MRILSGSEMRRVDAWTVEDFGLPVMLLMENAGNAVAQAARRILPEIAGSQIAIFVGKGNNGGDALVAARYLHRMGASVKLFLLFPPGEFSGAALENWQLLERMDLTWYLLSDENSFYVLKLCLNQCHLIIDGIFGTGFRGNPAPSVARVIQMANDSNLPILAIDIPSGLDADSGKVGEPCIKATVTVTMGWAKQGLFLYPGKKKVGELQVADIALPREGLENLETEAHYVDEALARSLLPVRDWEGHKNTFGHVLVIAGSPGMTGAAALACKAVLRAGAGMVTACLPRSLADFFDLTFPEVITRAMPETPERSLSSQAWLEIYNQLPGKKAVVFGPGLTTGEGIGDILRRLLEMCHVPLVLDADGLNVLADRRDLAANARCPLILTPHPGEMARLLGVTAKEVQQDRLETARTAARLFQAVVVLKGAATVIAAPAGHVYINSTGNPSLATAGTGDVLAGAIGSLLAQGLEPLKAAILGVYIHGSAGDIRAKTTGLQGVLAGEVADTLPAAFKALEQWPAADMPAASMPLADTPRADLGSDC